MGRERGVPWLVLSPRHPTALPEAPGWPVVPRAQEQPASFRSGLCEHPGLRVALHLQTGPERSLLGAGRQAWQQMPRLRVLSVVCLAWDWRDEGGLAECGVGGWQKVQPVLRARAE